jgi:hypothetical protein
MTECDIGYCRSICLCCSFWRAWLLTARCWQHDADSTMLTARCWQPDVDSTMLTARCWQHDVESPMLTARCWQHDAESTMLTTRCWQHALRSAHLRTAWPSTAVTLSVMSRSPHIHNDDTVGCPPPAPQTLQHVGLQMVKSLRRTLLFPSSG